MAALSQTTVVV